MPSMTTMAETAKTMKVVSGKHVPELMKDIEQDIKQGDPGKILTDVQGHLEQAPMDAAKQVMQGQMKNLMEDPVRAVEVAADAAKLAQDISKVLGQSESK